MGRISIRQWIGIFFLGIIKIFALIIVAFILIQVLLKG